MWISQTLSGQRCSRGCGEADSHRQLGKDAANEPPTAPIRWKCKLLPAASLPARNCQSALWQTQYTWQLRTGARLCLENQNFVSNTRSNTTCHGVKRTRVVIYSCRRVWVGIIIIIFLYSIIFDTRLKFWSHPVIKSAMFGTPPLHIYLYADCGAFQVYWNCNVQFQWDLIRKILRFRM